MKHIPGLAVMRMSEHSFMLELGWYHERFRPFLGEGVFLWEMKRGVGRNGNNQAKRHQ